MLLLPSPTLLCPDTLPFVPSAPLEQHHVLCDNSQPDFMTLSGHRCHFCPSSGTDPRGTPLPVPSQQPSSLLLIFLQLHVSGACTASRATITAFAKRSRPRWAQPQQRLLTAVCGKGAVCTRTAGFLISPSGDTFPCSRHLAHPFLSCQVL